MRKQAEEQWSPEVRMRRYPQPRRWSGLVGLAMVMAMGAPSAPALAADVSACPHFTNTRTFEIPGRGSALTWAPPTSTVAGGHAIAVAGHLIGRQTHIAGNERYDTKLFDTATGGYLKRFGVHYWWTVSNAWVVNPYVGEVIADGAGDHVVKVFFADGAGTDLGERQGGDLRGRYEIADGALPGIKAIPGNGSGLPNINGWITSLAFSPDGRWLAGASRDGTVRIWQFGDDDHPENQFRVVKVFFDDLGGNMLSVRWAPDGNALAIGDRKGRVRIVAFDPAHILWDAGTIADFARVTASKELSWLRARLGSANVAGYPLIADPAVWTRDGFVSAWNVRYSPDGRSLAVAATRNSTVYDLVDGTQQALVSEGHGLDFSPDGRWLALGGGDARLSFYDADATPAFSLYEVFRAHTEPVVGAVAWSPDGSMLASTAGGPLLGNAEFNASSEGGDDTVRLWELVDCQDPTTTTTTVPGSTTTSTTSTTIVHATTTTSTSTTTTTLPPVGNYPGFGLHTTGGQGYPTYVVTNSADAGTGSLRVALTRAANRGGGMIQFAVSDGGDIHPQSSLVIPANTTVDATGSHITLWGGSEGAGKGLLNVWNNNVIVVGLRVRNAVNDGIQIQPMGKSPLANVVIDRCSVTGSADGGIDVTGHGGQTTSDVTIMRSYVAGSGRRCVKSKTSTQPCGGGSLFKYGASNGTYYANLFDANLERAPLVSASGSRVTVVVDLRYNLARGTQLSSMSVREGAYANVIGNFFVGANDGIRVWNGGHAYLGGGNTDQNTAADRKNPPFRHLTAPLAVPSAPPAVTQAEALDAGALPHDAVDTCYRELPVHSFAAFGASECDQAS